MARTPVSPSATLGPLLAQLKLEGAEPSSAAFQRVLDAAKGPRPDEPGPRFTRYRRGGKIKRAFAPPGYNNNNSNRYAAADAISHSLAPPRDRYAQREVSTGVVFAPTYHLAPDDCPDQYDMQRDLFIAYKWFLSWVDSHVHRPPRVLLVGHECDQATCKFFVYGNVHVCHETANMHHCTLATCDRIFAHSTGRTCSLTARLYPSELLAVSRGRTDGPSADGDDDGGGGGGDDDEGRDQFDSGGGSGGGGGGGGDSWTYENTGKRKSPSPTSASATAAAVAIERKASSAPFQSMSSSQPVVTATPWLLRAPTAAEAKRKGRRSKKKRTQPPMTREAYAAKALTIAVDILRRGGCDNMVHARHVADICVKLWGLLAETAEYKSRRPNNYTFELHCYATIFVMPEGMNYGDVVVVPRVDCVDGLQLTRRSIPGLGTLTGADKNFRIYMREIPPDSLRFLYSSLLPSRWCQRIKAATTPIATVRK